MKKCSLKVNAQSDLPEMVLRAKNRFHSELFVGSAKSASRKFITFFPNSSDKVRAKSSNSSNPMWREASTAGAKSNVNPVMPP
jgi:hypothetical protein